MTDRWFKEIRKLVFGVLVTLFLLWVIILLLFGFYSTVNAQPVEFDPDAMKADIEATLAEGWARLHFDTLTFWEHDGISAGQDLGRKVMAILDRCDTTLIDTVYRDTTWVDCFEDRHEVGDVIFLPNQYWCNGKPGIIVNKIIETCYPDSCLIASIHSCYLDLKYHIDYDITCRKFEWGATVREPSLSVPEGLYVVNEANPLPYKIIPGIYVYIWTEVRGED